VKVSYNKGLAIHIVPRVMAVSPRGVAASVDRGRYGLGIEPRNPFPGCRELRQVSKAISQVARMASALRIPRGRRPHARIEASCAEPGRSHRWPWPVAKVRVARKKVQP
jgi:hypothetical protein